MRQRNFVYNIKNVNDSKIQTLRQLSCEYHIQGFKETILYGLIRFNSTKTICSVKKHTGYNTDFLQDNILDKMSELRLMEHTWEHGTPPQKGRNPQTKKESKEIELLCDIILKQQADNININNRKDEFIKEIQESKFESIKEQNKYLQDAIIELQKTIQTQAMMLTSSAAVAAPIQQTINNDARDFSNNKKITNINLFLNTECKDAITLQDFVHKIEVQEDDVLCIKEYGYAESIIRLLKRELNSYNVYDRPLHCSDIKREILHVKDKEGWKKETPSGESTTIDKAFRHISHKQNKKLNEVYKDIPVDSKQFEEKASVLYTLTQGSGSAQEKSKKKIIKSLAETVRI